MICSSRHPNQGAWIVIGGILLMTLSGCGAPIAPGHASSLPEEKASISRIHRDPERRREPLVDRSSDTTLDVSAFNGMPKSHVAAVREYIDAVCAAIQAEPVRRKRFVHQDNPDSRRNVAFPDDANVVPDRDMVVPLVVLPRPASVRKWADSSEGKNAGWRSAPVDGENRGSIYGRTLIFEPGTRSENPESLPAAPLGTDIPSWDAYVSEHDQSFFLELKKLVLTPQYDHSLDRVFDDSRSLRLEESNGATLLGEFITVPVSPQNERLWWTEVRHGTDVCRFLAYSLLDGNGVKRARRVQMTADGPISPYVRPLFCESHQPKTKQHDDLLLPVPVDWPPQTGRDRRPHLNAIAHEMWCLDDWFPEQPHACWVIREASDSQPLRESFLLMPASEKSDRPVFSIVLFADSEPRRLIEELSKLFQTSAETVLSSPATLERLDSLCEKVRDW